MVARNRRFPTQHGYARHDTKRDTERMLEDMVEDSVTEESGGSTAPANRLAESGIAAPPASRVALDLEPHVPHPPSIDLGAGTARIDRSGSPSRSGGTAWWRRMASRLWRWLSW